MTLCTICMRGGSKGIPNKNIRPLLGRPLLAYTIEQAQASRIFDHIVVSTDSESIAETARSFGAEAWFLRPTGLATDDMAKIPVIRHAFCEAEAHYGQRFNTIVDLDVTSPLRVIGDIRAAYDKFITNNADNLFTLCESRKNPYFNMVEEVNGTISLVKNKAQEVTRRQDAPQVFDINASIYIWKRETLINSNSLFNNKTITYVMPQSRSVDIDTEHDWQFVEYLMKAKLEQND